MGLRINTNLTAANAARQAGQATRGLNVALNRLGTGLRINRAADDAAGLAIAERFRTRINQYTQEANNLQTGINAIQTAEGGLGVQADALARIRELGIQAANGTLSPENRQALNAEAQQLIEQINAVGTDTQFNGMGLLNGEAQNVELGTEGGTTMNINESNAETLGVAGVDLTTVEGANEAINAVDTAAARVNANRASLGAQESRFTRAVEQRSIGIETNTAAEAAIRDADVARVVMERNRNQMLLQGGLAALVQSNVVPQSAQALLGR